MTFYVENIILSVLNFTFMFTFMSYVLFYAYICQCMVFYVHANVQCGVKFMFTFLDQNLHLTHTHVYVCTYI